MKCKICSHPKRLEIDKRLVSGHLLSMLSLQYNVPTSSLIYHRNNHLSRQLTQAYKHKTLAESMNLAQRIDSIIHRAEIIFQRNFDGGRDITALKALSEQRATIDLLARIAQYLHEANQEDDAQAEARRQREEQEQLTEMLKGLTDDELAMWNFLQKRLRGIDVPDWQRPEMYKRDSLPTPLPPPEIQPKNDFKAAKTDVQPEPEITSQPEPEEPEPEPLPPRRPTMIPCSSKSEQRRFVNELKGCKVKFWKGE